MGATQPRSVRSPDGFSDEEITALLASMTEGVFDMTGAGTGMGSEVDDIAVQVTPGSSAEENPVVSMLAGFFN